MGVISGLGLGVGVGDWLGVAAANCVGVGLGVIAGALGCVQPNSSSEAKTTPSNNHCLLMKALPRRVLNNPHFFVTTAKLINI
jgi:hypothetical protein